MPVRTVDPQSAELIRKRLEEMRDGPPFNGNMSALARDLGITAAYLSDVLNNQRGPGMKILKALAKVLFLLVQGPFAQGCANILPVLGQTRPGQISQGNQAFEGGIEAGLRPGQEKHALSIASQPTQDFRQHLRTFVVTDRLQDEGIGTRQGTADGFDLDRRKLVRFEIMVAAGE